jgi:transcription initiation factor TFIID TATA-box-binding protein
MSFALSARQITFGARPNVAQQQPYQFQQPQQHGLALPGGSTYVAPQQQPPPPPPATNALSLPGPTPYTASQPTSEPPSPPATSLPTPPNMAGATTLASTSATQVPSTPVPLTLEQQHITAVEGIVPTLQNIVATVNLDCRPSPRRPRSSSRWARWS